MNVLFIPSVEKGNGSGHLKRCIKYVSESLLNSFLYLPSEFLDKYSPESETGKLISSLLEKDIILSTIDRKFDIIVADKRNTSSADFYNYSGKTDVLVGLDEGGSMREYFPYLVDSFPSLSKHKPNIFSEGLLGIKDRRKVASESAWMGTDYKIDKILITFGGEDPENLTEVLLDIFSEENIYSGRKVKVIKGPLFKNFISERNNTEIINSPSSIEQFIDETDLVITSFGITAYEAVYAGKPVLLLNPSEYHSKLSKAAGIPEIGIKKPDRKLLMKYLADPTLIMQNMHADPGIPVSFDKILSEIRTGGISSCPFCRKKNIPLTRFPDRNYYRCSSSSLVYMQKFISASIDYGKEYFFDDYKKQYGRTYLEDFANIRKMSDERISILKKYKDKGKLLDIGCAYGPFLKSSKEAGYNSSGIDVSEDAVEYVNKNLGIDASVKDFRSWKPDRKDNYDIISMWYVIEHFENPGEIFDKVYSIIPDGGIFAFSTPNLTGVSGRTDLKKTLYQSPYDHYTFWSISSAVHILKEKNFEILEIRNTGHHPERFSLKIRKIIPEAVLKHISFLLKLGDTFEIYARKQVYRYE